MSFQQQHSPSTIPHAVFLPRTRFPFTWYSLSLPTTAKGIVSCGGTYFNTTQQTGENCPRFMGWNKYITCPTALTSLQEDAVMVVWGRTERCGWEWKITGVVREEQQNHLLWSCRCRSCPPYRHQTPSVGKTRCRSSPAPFLPTAEVKAEKL